MQRSAAPPLESTAALSRPVLSHVLGHQSQLFVKCRVEALPGARAAAMGRGEGKKKKKNKEESFPWCWYVARTARHARTRMARGWRAGGRTARADGCGWAEGGGERRWAWTSAWPVLTRPACPPAPLSLFLATQVLRARVCGREGADPAPAHQALQMRHLPQEAQHGRRPRHPRPPGPQGGAPRVRHSRAPPPYALSHTHVLASTRTLR